MRMSFIISIIVLICMVMSQVFAGIYIEGTTTNADGSRKEKSIVYLNSDRMRVENTETEAENAPDVIIFRHDKKVMWVIDKKAGTYMEMTQKDLEQMKSKMDEGMKMMQEQMKNMPPEQRKMMEEMMAKQMPQQMAEQEKTIYKKVASGVKFKSWTCDKYEGSEGGTKSDEVWTITPSQAGFKMDDFMVMRGFASFFEPLGAGTNDFVMIGTEEDVKTGGFQGMPVKYINFDNGKVSDTFELEKMETRSNPASLFELPANLKKKDIWQNPE